MGNTSINRVIEEFEGLPLEDKEYVAEILKKQVIELKRQKLLVRAQEAKGNLERGTVNTGTVKDLFEDLESD